jgi:hypothetical protein
VEARGIVIVVDERGSSTVMTIIEPDGAGPCPLSGFPPGAACWSDEKPGIAAPRTINRISMNMNSFFLILFTSRGVPGNGTDFCNNMISKAKFQY